jgi:hypothetical protein
MQLINVNGTYVNLDRLAFARPDRGIDGKIKLRLGFSGGAEMQFTGEAAYRSQEDAERLARVLTERNEPFG